MWDVQHPWLNLLIPKSKIQKFAEGVLGNILTETSNGPILIYPVHRWDNRTSEVIPDETILYLVDFLTSAFPSSTGTDGLDYMLTQNRRIMDFCEKANLGMKQYLPHYTTREEWRAHFGSRWEEFVQRKSAYDPLVRLAAIEYFKRRCKQEYYLSYGFYMSTISATYYAKTEQEEVIQIRLQGTEGCQSFVL